MSAVATAIVGSAVVGAYSASKASKRAANAQTDANMAAIDAQERQIEEMRKLLLPYVQASSGIAADPGGKFDGEAYLAMYPDVARYYTAENAEDHYLQYGQAEGRNRPLTAATAGRPGALQGQQDLLGLNGSAAQQASIDALKSSPMFTSMLQQGENSILQNASATGGLRGGNVQAALAQFSPALLAATINDQYSKLSGITSLGQNSAVGAGNNGMQGGANISNLLGQIGSAQAGGALGQASAISGLAGNVSGGLGMYAALGGFGGRGMSSLQQARFSQTALGASGFGTGRAYGNQDYGDFI
jgi:hypothetical protein